MPLRVSGLEAKDGVNPATLGVNGILLVVFVFEALKVGTIGLEAPFCLSCGGIALPLREPKGAPLCGTRIMALPSHTVQRTSLL